MKCFSIVVLTSSVFAASLHAVIDHGTIHVTSGFSGGSGISFAPNTTAQVEFTNPSTSNEGDYALEFQAQAGTDETQDGVLITSVAENGRSGNYATAHVERGNSVENGPYYFIPVFQAGVSQTEINMNVSFAYFSFEDFWGGRILNTTNNGDYNTFIAILGFTALITNDYANAPGVLHIDFGSKIAPNSQFPAHPDNGILLVSGAKNEANYALSRANSDGTFSIFCHDNNANQDTYENDPVALAYIPFDHSSAEIVAMGRISGVAENTAISTGASSTAGSFNLTKASTGRWYLEVDGYNHNNATLIVSPEGGDTFNIDNILSAEWSTRDQHWEIQSRDLVSVGLQDVNIGEPSFSFAVIARPELARTIYVDTTASSGNNTGVSWEDAFMNLQSALENAAPGDEIWVAEGNYEPSEGSGRDRTFSTVTGVAVYGGFPAGGSVWDGRDPEAYLTVLSGNVGSNSSSSDNTYHVVTVNADSTLDGFTITEGVTRLTNSYSSEISGITLDPDYMGAGISIASGSGAVINQCTLIGNNATYGGAVAGASSAGSGATFTNCAFYANTATLDGGAINLYRVGLTFVNCVFIGNAAGDGNDRGIGGVAYSNTFLYGSVSTSYFYNCTIANNLAPPAYQIPNGLGGFITITQSGSFEVTSNTARSYDTIIWNNTSNPSGLHYIGNNLLENTNPSFIRNPDPGDGNWKTLSDNDYGDLNLQFGSPAIGAGNNANNSSSTDITGINPRTVGTIDLGAYESAFPDPTALSNWAIENGLSFENSLASSDSDQDGRPLIEEFAFDGNPTQASSDGKQRASLTTVTDKEYLTLTIPVRNGASFTGTNSLTAAIDGIPYEIRGSTELQTWTRAMVEVTPAIDTNLPNLNAGWSYRTFRFPTSTADEAQGFIQALVNQAP